MMMPRAHCWWQDREGFIREGVLDQDEDGRVLLIADDGTVLSPQEMDGIEIHRLGTSKYIVEIREAARRSGYNVIDR